MSNDDLKRRLVFGLFSLLLGLIATRMARYLTDLVLGKPDDELLPG